MATPKTQPAKQSLLKNPWIPGALLVIVFIVMLLYWTGVITFPHIGNSNTEQQNGGQPNVQDGISTTPSNSSSSSGATDDTPITPSIKIESVTTTSIGVSDLDNSRTCTVKVSGTVTGPICSFLTLTAGRTTNGELGPSLYPPYECPSWRYWGTSALCSRDPWAPATTNWSITVEQTLYDWENYKREFIAILDTPKQPLVANPSGGNLCTSAVQEKRFTDSVFFTCQQR